MLGIIGDTKNECHLTSENFLVSHRQEFQYKFIRTHATPQK